MWRQQQQYAQQSMGYSAYPESQMMPDERYLETIHEVESLYSRRNSVAATIHHEQTYNRAVPSADKQRQSISSLYSNEPVSPLTEHPEPPSQYPPSQSTVSPVSSHERLPTMGSDASVVSPMEASFPASASQAPPQPTSYFTSHLPRRLPQSKPLASPDPPQAKRASREFKSDTKWDDYSGEPSDSGKPPSVKTAPAMPLEQQYPQLKERTRQILAGLKDKEGVKKSAFAQPAPQPAEPDPLDHPVQRPAWKGASGRTTLVEPVKNTPTNRTRPLLLLQRNKKKEESKQAAAAADSEQTEQKAAPSNTASAPLTTVTPSKASAAAQTPTLRAVSSVDSIRRIASLKGGITSSPRVESPVPIEHHEPRRALESPFHSPGLVHPRGYEAAPSPVPSNFQAHPSDSPTLGSEPSIRRGERSSSEDSFAEPAAIASPAPIRAPSSRLLKREPDTTSSWNTYTSADTTAFSSAGIADHIPSRELSSSPAAMNFAPPPIMLRKRAAANNSGVSEPAAVTLEHRRSLASITRKPVGDRPRTLSLMSTMSISKSLPPTPVEAEASDKVVGLEARLESLERRKRNIHKIINELNTSLKKNAIIYDTRKRKEVEKMITNLNIELQDITNEEHEVGLKLHRVQKRRDKDDFYEKPTGLWIKRVTS